MDIHDLHNLGWCGSTLNVAERTLLEAGLVKRKLEEGLVSIGFWGRVAGTDADYLVAVGRLPSGGSFPRKKFYFCTSKAHRLQAVPDLTPSIAAKAAGVRGRLRGDPSLPLEAAGGEEEGAKLVESHRLAYIVAAIDAAAAVVPRGAYTVDGGGAVIRDPAFAGLSPAEAGSAEAYVRAIRVCISRMRAIRVCISRMRAIRVDISRVGHHTTCANAHASRN